MVIKKVITSTVKPTDSTLCCQINPELVCYFCRTKLCRDCGQAWSGRKHFIIDMCRGRFTQEQLEEAAICFKKRIVDGKTPTDLGDCYVCRYRKQFSTIRTNKDTYYDRFPISHLKGKKI